VPVAINTALSGIPYWGTDIGGFVPTSEFLGELYVRWFQFGAFCPLFRAHGRTWHLRLPWGWNLGDLGPEESQTYQGAGRPPDSELHNAAVEPICRKYLELRYRLMPYLYSAVRECSTTGMPIVRALWLHYPDEPAAVARGDEYLWGRDLLVAPVVEKGATSRRVYLPPGGWFDFWTEERVDGGRETDRAVDLETMPLYARAGAIIPMGPVKQYTSEVVSGPLSVTVYPGADGAFEVFEDDGKSFDYQRGAWMGLSLKWADRGRRLSIALTPGSRMRSPLVRDIEIRLAGRKEIRSVKFSGRPVNVTL
jgi:alpha-glucosidase/alpha-D-xyloside xylohydrolase